MGLHPTMKHRIALVAFILTVCTSSTFASSRLNLIFFLSDDHRADVLGCAGHPIVKTPNIDTLAALGRRFTNAFVTTSICAASRATIFTGLVERTHGYTFGKAPISRAHIADSYPAQLKAAGYRTGFVGKFGVKVEGGQATVDTMFDSFVPLGRSQKQADSSTRHFTDIVGDKALEFITNNPEDKPFCLSVSFNAAHASDGDMKHHYPYPTSEAGLYRELTMPRPKLDGNKFFDAQPLFLRESMNRDRYYWRWDTAEKYDHNMRNYFRMLSGLDRNMGRVMDELNKRNLTDNTVILFMGDNGYYMGERGFAGKWSHYEQSLRVPLVIYDPSSKDNPGEISSNIALNLDIAPTLLQLANVSLPRGHQGVSITELAKASAREGFFCEHRMDNKHIPKWEGFRGQQFFYANYYQQKSNQEFLHNLKNDPDQLKNLATDPDYAKVLAKMRAKTKRLSQSYASQSPAR
jgi:arylsulfatase A-like enzyme